MGVFGIFKILLMVQNRAKYHITLSNPTFPVILILFNRDLNCACLVYMFSLRFSGSKFLINLQRQLRARKIFSCT